MASFFKKLTDELDPKKRENAILTEGLQELLRYVQSEKFSVDPMVNSSDIILRINEIKADLNRCN